MPFDRRDREMRLFKRIFWTIFIGAGLCATAGVAFQTWVIYQFATNPEAAGEFIGQIIRGVVNEASR